MCISMQSLKVRSDLMEVKCKSCGKSCNIKISKYIKVLMRRKMIFMCETCEDLVDWKTDMDPYSSNKNQFGLYECTLKCFDSQLYNWLNKKVLSNRVYCELKIKDGTVYNCFPVDLRNDYLICCKDEFDPLIECGTHRIGEVGNSIPLNYILGIRILDIYKDYIEPDVQEPIYGYKGVTLIDGVLKARDYIYEIGIPYEEPQRNPYHTDFQDVYSHFCIRIEDVLLNYRDFISSPISYSQGMGYGEVRLFLVKGERHCFQNTTYGWVSNRLTLISEVSKEEIITYFNKNPDLKLSTEKHFKDGNSTFEDAFLEYAKADIKPYKEFISNDDIDHTIVQSCPYKKNDYCHQNGIIEKFEKCKQCKCYKYFMEYKEKTYCYLILRNAIRKGIFYETDINYQYLCEHNCKSELDAIQRLLKYKQMG